MFHCSIDLSRSGITDTVSPEVSASHVSSREFKGTGCGEKQHQAQRKFTLEPRVKGQSGQPQHCRKAVVILFSANILRHKDTKTKTISMQQKRTKEQSPLEQPIQVERDLVHLICPTHAVQFSEVSKSSWVPFQPTPRSHATFEFTSTRLNGRREEDKLRKEVGTDTQEQLGLCSYPKPCGF